MQQQQRQHFIRNAEKKWTNISVSPHHTKRYKHCIIFETNGKGFKALKDGTPLFLSIHI